MNFRCLLFDLDGTLVDSRADIINSVNFALEELRLTRLPDAQVLTFVGEGARLLVERALRAARGSKPTPDDLDAAYEIFRRQYRAHLFDHTRAYAGVATTLEQFADLPKAIVTNKPYELTVPLLDGIALTHHFRVILGGDSLPERKPDPAMLLEAARQCGVAPDDCLMIGDSWVDVRAGQAAGMRTCGFTAGFRGRAELVEAGADFSIERFDELLALVRGAPAAAEMHLAACLLLAERNVVWRQRTRRRSGRAAQGDERTGGLVLAGARQLAEDEQAEVAERHDDGQLDQKRDQQEDDADQS